MALNGYIIAKYNKMTNGYAYKRLLEEAAERGVDLQVIGINDTQITQPGLRNNNYDLEHRDFVINRYKWGNLKDELNSLRTKAYPPLDSFKLYGNKFEQVKRLHSEAFLMPRYQLGTAEVIKRAVKPLALATGI